ncbi:zinc finger MYM-type protein 1-like, partial [Aphis craccivora]
DELESVSENITTAIACYENCHQNVASSSSFGLNTDQLKPIHNDEIYVPGTTDHADAVEQCEIGSLEKIQSQENSNFNQIFEGHDKDHSAIGNQVLKVGEDTVFNNDTATFCSLKTFPQHFINWILKAGPSQPTADDFIDHKFPTENNRSFHSSWYYKILPSGDIVNPNWLTFRGHREGWKEKLHGNFKDLAILLSKYSPVMTTYITELESSGKKRNYLSWNRQNQLIDSIAYFIRSSIIQDKRATSLVVRYIKDLNVYERVIAVHEVTSTTGQNLLEVFTKICLELDLNWKKYLVGQAYDGASNMRGAYNGLQALIKEHNSSVLYIWCWAHRLNLIITDAVNNCTDSVKLFGILETIYDFICSSKNRVSLFEKHQKMLYPGKPIRQPKRVETTRWMSHSYALNNILSTYHALLETLEELMKPGKSSDRKEISQASNIFDLILSEKILLTAFVFKKIFEILEPLNKVLQSKDIDLLGAINSVNECLKMLNVLRDNCDIEFNQIFKTTHTFIKPLNKTVKDYKVYNISPLTQTRIIYSKRRYAEESIEEPIIDPVKTFKIKTFLPIIDVTITQISDRFSERCKGVLKDLSLFSRKRLKEIKQSPSSLPIDTFSEICDNYKQFLNLEDLKREYLQFSHEYWNFECIKKLPENFYNSSDYLLSDIENSSDSEDEEQENKTKNSVFENVGSILSLYNICCSCGLNIIFPNLYTALKISLTLPTSSASPERIFSKLKLVKNKLRSTMSAERLDGLMLIACETDIHIDEDKVLDNFANSGTYLKNQLI